MSDIEIARKAKKKHIKEIASKLNLDENDLRPYGHYIAKIDMNSINKLPKSNSKLILALFAKSLKEILFIDLGFKSFISINVEPCWLRINNEYLV